MVKNKLIRLKDLSQDYEAIVFDTCAILGYLNGKGKPATNDNSEFAKFLLKKDRIKQYACFIPETVKKELVGNSYCTELEKILVDKFSQEQRILSVEDFPLGTKVFKKDKYAQEFLEKYHVHLTDLRVMSWALELNDFYNEPVAVVSNDMKGLAKFWNDLCKEKFITKEQIGFFPRRGLDLYEVLVA